MNAAVPPLRRGFAAIALLSCAVLLYEIALTRLLSAVLWYHWAFLCISLAMLGLGAPGVWLSIARDPMRFLRPLILLSAALVPLSVVLIVRLGGTFRSHAVLFCMGSILLPMLCLGGAVCLLLMAAEGRSLGRMYGSDLAGACLGALLVIPLLVAVPTPLLVGAVGFLPLLAHVVLDGRPSRPAIAVALALLALLAWGEPFRLRYTKNYEETEGLRPILETWTPISRLTVFDRVFWVDDPRVGFLWGPGKRAKPTPIEQYWIEQDGSAGTPLTRFDGDLGTVGYLFDDVTTVGFQLRPPRAALIIGAGGGRDVLTARLAGARTIDAVEINGALVGAVSGRFREFSGDVLRLPGVRAVVAEGRSFLARSPQRYDAIQLSLVDSWAATAAGAYALSENNLYTVEAFELYLRRLSERGIVSASRWYLGTFGAETPRLAILAQEALRRIGEANPNAHIAIVQGSRVATLLVSRAPFRADDLSRLSAICRERGFAVLYPSTGSDPSSSVLVDLLDRGPGAIRAAGIRLDPPVDDRPFFFQVLSPFRWVDASVTNRFGINGEAVRALQLLMVAMTVLAAALFLLPFLVRGRLGGARGGVRGSAYFFLIGSAFMLIEIPWLQRFVLFLGHPSYATPVVLASLLVGAALGSAASARVRLSRTQALGFGLPLALLAVNHLLSPVFESALGLPLSLRVAGALLLLTPTAFLMGFSFPAGMARFGDGGKPWFWAMNGVAGVLASVMSLPLAMVLGLTAVSSLGCACYAVAWLLLLGSREQSRLALDPPLEGEEEALRLEPSPVAGQRSVRADHPVARQDDR